MNILKKIYKLNKLITVDTLLRGTSRKYTKEGWELSSAVYEGKHLVSIMNVVPLDNATWEYFNSDIRNEVFWLDKDICTYCRPTQKFINKYADILDDLGGIEHAITYWHECRPDIIDELNDENIMGVTMVFNFQTGSVAYVIGGHEDQMPVAISYEECNSITGDMIELLDTIIKSIKKSPEVKKAMKITKQRYIDKLNKIAEFN